MAEKLFNYWQPGTDSINARACSAGVSAVEGVPATGETRKVLEEKGLSVEHHRSRPVTDELVKDSHLIVVMTFPHQETLYQRYPEAYNKIRILKNINSHQREDLESQDIKDPFGGNLEEYRRTLQEIEKHIKKLIENLEDILKAAEENGGRNK